MAFTGTFSFDRTVLIQWAKDAGAQVHVVLNSRTTLLVEGNHYNETSKLRAAAELQTVGTSIRIISESQFLQMVTSGTPSTRVTPSRPVSAPRKIEYQLLSQARPNEVTDSRPPSKRQKKVLFWALLLLVSVIFYALTNPPHTPEQPKPVAMHEVIYKVTSSIPEATISYAGKNGESDVVVGSTGAWEYAAEFPDRSTLSVDVRHNHGKYEAKAVLTCEIYVDGELYVTKKSNTRLDKEESALCSTVIRVPDEG